MNSADRLEGDESRTGSRVKGVCMFTLGVAIVVGITVSTMMVMAAPDGLVMKTAVKAIIDQQQAIAIAYLH